MYSRWWDGGNPFQLASAFAFFFRAASMNAGVLGAGFGGFVARGTLTPASFNATASRTILTSAASDGTSSSDSNRPNCPIASGRRSCGTVFISDAFQNASAQSSLNAAMPTSGPLYSNAGRRHLIVSVTAGQPV